MARRNICDDGTTGDGGLFTVMGIGALVLLLGFGVSAAVRGLWGAEAGSDALEWAVIAASLVTAVLLVLPKRGS